MTSAQYWKQVNEITVQRRRHQNFRVLAHARVVLARAKSKGGSLEARHGTKLVTECCGHGGSGSIHWGAASVVNKPDLDLRFFDHYRRGFDNGIDREPPARLLVMVPPDTGDHRPAQCFSCWLKVKKSKLRGIREQFKDTPS
jgi:hypothetical protein